ncbi:MAG: ABC transporter permease [Actinomycetota bacterium]|nr:ABC transporter permease [Actinomycetota bacterium]
MKTFTIASNSLRRLFRDRANLFFIFVLPIVLILVLGLVFGTGFTSRVAVITPDGDALAGDIADRLSSSTAFVTVDADDVDAARVQLRRNDIDAVIVVPNGYQDSLLNGDSVEIAYYSTPSGGGFEVRSVVEAAIAEQAAAIRAGRFAAEATDANPATALETARLVQGSIATVGTKLEGDVSGGGGSQFDVGAAQQLLLFMFLTALTSSTALIQSRRLGVSHRMLSTPTTAGTIIGGETLGRFLVVMFQGVFIVVAAGVLFSVEWGDPVAAMLVVTAFALTGTGAGMLLGSAFSSEQQAGGFAIFGALMLAALGGSMVPLEIFPDTMVTIAHFTPHAWGNDAFATLIRHSGGVADITKELAVLTAYGMALVVLASAVFRRSLTR